MVAGAVALFYYDYFFICPALNAHTHTHKQCALHSLSSFLTMEILSLSARARVDRDGSARLRERTKSQWEARVFDMESRAQASRFTC